MGRRLLRSGSRAHAVRRLGKQGRQLCESDFSGRYLPEQPLHAALGATWRALSGHAPWAELPRVPRRQNARVTAAHALLEPLLALHQRLRDDIVAATERQHVDRLAAVSREEAADTIYAIDVVGEAVIERFAETLARDHSFVLVAEGLAGGRQCWGGD